MKNSGTVNNKTAQRNWVKSAWGFVLIVVLFGAGVMLGMSVRTDNRDVVRSGAAVQFTESQCDTISARIDDAVRYGNYDKLERLKNIYAESCDGHIQAKTEIVADTDNALSTCQKIEKLLLRNLKPADSQDPSAHRSNAELYSKLSQHGCPENTDAFKNLVSQETAIANALGMPASVSNLNVRTCEEIESVLKQQLFEFAGDSQSRLKNAEIYSTLSQRGCPENAEKYKQMALRQIDVVSAVSNDAELADPENQEMVIDTYNKLQMQKEAREFLRKMDKLVDPGVELIHAIGQMVNE